MLAVILVIVVGYRQLGPHAGEQRIFRDSRRDWRIGMENWDKFRTFLVERTEPAKRRRERLAKAKTVLVVVATLLLVIMLVVLVHERMPALVA